MCSVDMPETEEIPMPFAPVQPKKAKVRGKRVGDRRNASQKLRSDRDDIGTREQGLVNLLIPVADAIRSNPLSVPSSTRQTER